MEVCTRPIRPRQGLDPLFETMQFSATTVTTWCDACHNAETGTVDAMTGWENWHANFVMMGATDSIAFWLCTSLVALHIGKESSEVVLCNLALRQAQETIPKHWRYSFLAMNFARRYLFLPGIPVAIVMVLLTNGADAMSICFNSVALVFLCEVDEVFYQLALPERVRLVTTRIRARVVLSSDEEDQLFKSRVILQVSVAMGIRIGMSVLAHGAATTDLFLYMICQWAIYLPAEVSLAVQLETRSRIIAKIAWEIILVPLMCGCWFMSFIIINNVLD